MGSGRLFFLIFFLSPAILFAQRYSISGYITDAASGESLVGANVVIEEMTRGTSTNEYGFYSVTLDEGNYTITVSFLGYEPFVETVNLTENKRLHISLNQSDLLTEEVVVRGERSDRNIESTDLGRVDFSIDKIRTLPVLLGEVDIMKTLQLLPGVQSAGEGNSGFYVRGGGPDQNLVLLDEAVVYNPGHLFGFFSVFNGDAIRNATMIKGGMPAQYGGRLSSVIDISMKEGNNKEYKFSGGVGLLASRLLVEGPIVKEKASFMISARRTYIDLFLDPILENVQDGEFKGNSYFFYDLNAKFNYRFSERSRFFLSGYFGRDVFNFRSAEQSLAIDIPWGNATTTFRWNYLINDRLFLNATAVYNDYNFSFISKFQDEFQFELASGIKDYNVKLDFDYFPNINHRIKTGLNYTYHTFDPYNASARSDDQEFEIDEVATKYAHELAVYVQDDFSITDRLKVNVGLRGTVFQQAGPYKRYILDDLDRPIDSTSYGPLEPVHTYWGIEPRFSLRYTIDGQSSFKAGIMNTKQYIHMVSSATTTLPTDLWVPSTKIVKPQNGWQYSAGYFRNFLEDRLETSVEFFYRTMDNQIEFKNSYTPNLYTDIEESFVFGDGNAYGVEFFIQQNFGGFFGWIGYTLSFANRTFKDLNEGEPFPAKFDRRHDLSITTSYQINDKWNVGILFVYGTGQAITLPTGRYFIEGNIVNQYEERNGFRMPPYHRLDLSATYTFPKKRRFESELVFSIYNVYSRMNPFFIFNDIEGNIFQGNVNVKAQQVSLFPILPSVSYNFNF